MTTLSPQQRDDRIESIRALVPELLRQRHTLLLVHRRPVEVILPDYLDPGPEPDGDPTVPARLFGLPVTFVRRATPLVVGL